MDSEQLEFTAFMEDVYEALKADCRAIGAAMGNPKGWAKEVGHCLWPQKSPDDAGKLLANCLDHHRVEKLDPEQVIWIISKAREAGAYVSMHYICDATSFTKPEPITPDDQLSQLMREFNDATKRMDVISRRMAAIKQ